MTKSSLFFIFFNKNYLPYREGKTRGFQKFTYVD